MSHTAQAAISGAYEDVSAKPSAETDRFCDALEEAITAEPLVPHRHGVLTIPVPPRWQPVGLNTVPPLFARLMTRDIASQVAYGWNEGYQQGYTPWSLVVKHHHTGAHRWGIVRIPVVDWRPQAASDLPPDVITGVTHKDKTLANAEIVERCHETGTEITEWAIVVNAAGLWWLSESE